jgi:sucrose phosphorylase
VSGSPPPATLRPAQERLRGHLERLYSPEVAAVTLERLLSLLAAFMRDCPAPVEDEPPLDESSAVLITYPDQISERGTAPLRSLREFLTDHRVGEMFSGIHLLPFYPASADDGFAVVDHTAVDPRLGSWEDVVELGRSFWLMVDAVVNHTSARGIWFRRWLEDDPAVADFFLEVHPGTDLSSVVRTRSSPLVHCYPTANGGRRVWTTFGPDQVDLNYGNPQVLLAMTGVILHYLRRGARVIRLDAVGFLCKRVGSSCLHLPETHEVVRLWRTVLDAVAPGAALITETRGPLPQVTAYLGNGHDEAHLVYQFALPPLVLDAFVSQDASLLRELLPAHLRVPSPAATFLNVLGTHDGIGMRPVTGLLPQARIDRLVERILACGGQVTHVELAEGRRDLFELNAVYYDALAASEASGSPELGLRRFFTAHALQLALPGIPGVYVQALFGGRNWPEGVARTGSPRSINRRKFARRELEAQLADHRSLPHCTFKGLSALLRVRRKHPAFHPRADFRLLPGGRGLCAFVRVGADDRSVLCVHNVSGRPASLWVGAAEAVPLRPDQSRVIAGHAKVRAVGSGLALEIPPCGFAWLTEHVSRATQPPAARSTELCAPPR